MNASVIKKLEVPSLRDRVSTEEWDTRVQLAAAYRLADMHNWTTFPSTSSFQPWNTQRRPHSSLRP